VLHTFILYTFMLYILRLYTFMSTPARKAELSRRSRKKLLECEGLLLPDDSVAIDNRQTHNMGADTAPRFPFLVWLPCASWLNIKSASLQMPWPDWLFNVQRQ
jgi:hypothetical protein